MTEGSTIIIRDVVDFYNGREAIVTEVTNFSHMTVISWTIFNEGGSINGATRIENVEFVK